MPAVQQRRNKLAKRLHEQIELARAQQTGAHYAPIKFRTVKDAETGARKQIETNKDRKSTRLNSSHTDISRMPSSA